MSEKNENLTKQIQLTQKILKEYLLIPEKTELHVTQIGRNYIIVDKNNDVLNLPNVRLPFLGHTEHQATSAIYNYALGLTTALHLVKILL
jgi:hypothetical protein